MLIERAVGKLKGQALQNVNEPTAPAVTHKAIKPGERVVNVGAEILRRLGFTESKDVNARLLHEFRRIKNVIVRNTQDVALGHKKSALVLVTSSVPGEGKSFVAMHLAMTLSRDDDYSVLLVDADVVLRSLTREFGLAEAPGLTDVLVDGSLAISDVVHSTNVERFAVVPSGSIHARASELLSGRKMGALAEELSKGYASQITILDCSPVLATSDAQSLAAHVGQVLFVVEAARTPQRAVNAALEVLGEMDDKAINLVLNKTKQYLLPDEDYDGYEAKSYY